MTPSSMVFVNGEMPFKWMMNWVTPMAMQTPMYLISTRGKHHATACRDSDEVPGAVLPDLAGLANAEEQNSNFKR